MIAISSTEMWKDHRLPSMSVDFVKETLCYHRLPSFVEVKDILINISTMNMVRAFTDEKKQLKEEIVPNVLYELELSNKKPKISNDYLTNYLDNNPIDEQFNSITADGAIYSLHREFENRIDSFKHIEKILREIKLYNVRASVNNLISTQKELEHLKVKIFKYKIYDKDAYKKLKELKQKVGEGIENAISVFEDIGFLQKYIHEIEHLKNSAKRSIEKIVSILKEIRLFKAIVFYINLKGYIIPEVKFFIERSIWKRKIIPLFVANFPTVQIKQFRRLPP